LDVRVEAPACVDVVLRRKAGRMMVHLISRSSGTPNGPSFGAVDEVPPVGPVSVEMKLLCRPARVGLALGKRALELRYIARSGKALFTVDREHISAAVVVG
jgi:hypothetical protein